MGSRTRWSGDDHQLRDRQLIVGLRFFCNNSQGSRRIRLSTLLTTTWVGLKGRYYEALALRYLKSQGLRLLQKNYRCTAGEIDLIMIDKRTLIFVEVRFREDEDFGTAIETIDHRKQRKVLRAAQHFLLLNKIYNAWQCRFDVVGITKKNNAVEFCWLPNAFD
jgi:putative endonuclease